MKNPRLHLGLKVGAVIVGYCMVTILLGVTLSLRSSVPLDIHEIVRLPLSHFVKILEFIQLSAFGRWGLLPALILPFLLGWLDNQFFRFNTKVSLTLFYGLAIPGAFILTLIPLIGFSL